MTRVRQIRNAAGIPQHVAAAMAGVSCNSWRLYENAPEAVSATIRPGCDAALKKLEELAANSQGAE